MKLILKILLVFSILLMVKFLNGQIAKTNSSWRQPYYIGSNEIELSLIFEGTIKIQDTELKSYSLSWLDTLGSKQNFPSSNRPYELKVIIRDKDTIVGEYTA